MKRNFALIVSTLLLISSGTAYGFGATGHRVVGQIGDNYLTEPARKEIQKILGGQTLAQVATWPDDIRSDPDWSHAGPWYYVTIEDGETYETSKKNKDKDGNVIDAIAKLEEFLATLENPGASTQEKEVALKWVVHLVGDLHQPLHVGRGPDRGGNLVSVEWHGEKTNLHTVWDSSMLQSTELSYSEMAAFLENKTSPDDMKEWQSQGLMAWVEESLALRNTVYTVPLSGSSASYTYAYQNLPVIEKRMTQAGVRLANELNRIFD